jgi:phage terminase large subunit-like protein
MGKRGPKRKLTVETGPSIGAAWDDPALPLWERVVKFIECLPITSGKFAGTNMVLRPWQVEIIQKLFRTDETGRRIVRTAVITMPRKCGKTQLAAAIAACFIGPGPCSESLGQCFALASDIPQASILFAEIEQWILRIPEFKERLTYSSFHKKIEDTVTGTIFRCLGSRPGSLHGLGPSFLCYDESAQARTSELWDNVTSGTGAREQPLMMTISTKSPDPHHFLSGLIDYGRKVNAGEIDDPTFLLVEYAAPLDADPWDEKTWFACNPALGDFRSLEEMRIFADQARRIPAKESVFRSLYLNQEISMDSRFVSFEDWKACEEEAPLTGPCFGGADVGAVQDLTGLILYWPLTGAIRCWAWLPGDPPLSERAARDRAPYDLWHQQGFLHAYDGRATDMGAVAMTMMDVCSRFDVKAIAYDRWGIQQIQKILHDEGGDHVNLVPHGQGFKDMSVAINSLERAVLDHRLRHGDNPILNWCMSNIKIATDPAGGRKFAKDKATGRIDLAVALAMAVGTADQFMAGKEKEFILDDSTLAIL